jgi:ribosomal protein S18 acetylase RimI-like enzyme
VTAADDRGLPLEPFLYLSARAADVAGLHAAAVARQRETVVVACGAHAGGGDTALDRWRDGDLERAADLLHESYTLDSGDCFAPHGEHEEWLRYVTVLVEDTQCGTLDPMLTRVLRDAERLRALALVTSVSPTIVHVAQLAVHPDWRREGLATWLLADVAAAAAATGREEITLLVRESNRGARRLYAALGFTPQGMGAHYDTLLTT